MTVQILRGRLEPGLRQTSSSTGASRLIVSANPTVRFPLPLSERDLAYLWEGQRFPAAALRTRDGRQLRVVYRGRATGGPGPDYRDAILSTRQALLQGDVELHVRSSDFRRHGHHRDPRYDGLALHLVFWHDEDCDTELASGRQAPVVALSDWVQGRAREIQDWLRRPVQWQEPCASAMARLGGAEVGRTLDRLGDMRFRQKTGAFAARLKEVAVDQALWEGLLEALGYGGERELLGAVAQLLSWEQLRGELLAVAARGRPVRAEELLFAALEAERRLQPHRAERRPASLRPRNRAEARLEGAAVLAARFAADGLWRSLRPLLETAAEGEARKRLAAALTVAGSIGRGRALEILTNVVLPCAAALGDAGDAQRVFGRLPLAARYGAVRHIVRALGEGFPLNARRQQGMLYLLKDYCTKGGCGRCALS